MDDNKASTCCLNTGRCASSDAIFAAIRLNFAFNGSVLLSGGPDSVMFSIFF